MEWREWRQKHLIWFGGWERGKGWQLRLESGYRMPPYPVTLFGRVTLYSWGVDVKLRRSYLVYTCINGRRLYVSPDGTPSRATRWFIGRGTA